MLPKLSHFLASVLALLAVASAAHAQTTFYVPSPQYPTIQSAINAAAPDGDTVLVAAGTYNENLDFQSKSLTLTGPAVSFGTTPTAILDGGFKGPAITLVSGVFDHYLPLPEASTIENLLIQHGGSIASFYPVFTPALGAIFIENAVPTILNNTIVDSACFGIQVEVGAATIQGNTISGTEGGQCYYGGGSAIFISGDQSVVGGYIHSTVIGNTLENNIESGLDSSDGIDGGGAGIAVAGSSLILDNIIRNNNSNGSAGGGIDVIDASGLTIAQNLIYGNTGCGGGGIALPPSGIGPRLVALITNNTIVDNTDSPKGCTPSTQLYEFAADATDDGPEIVIVNNILSSPASSTDASIDCALPVGVVPSEATQPILDHNILYNAHGNFFGQYCIDVSAKYGNLTADPNFVDQAAADFSLNAGSPAIDAGNNSALALYQGLSAPPLSGDINGDPRLQNATPALNYPVIDIGAYEYNAVTSLPPPTTIVLTTSAYTGHPGYNYVLTATLAGSQTTPTGAVTFFLDGAQIGTPQTINGGTATLSNFLMPPGVHSLYASYAGDGSASPAISVINIVDITLIITDVLLVADPQTSNFGQTVAFTVTSSSADGTIPSPVYLTDVTDPENPVALTTFSSFNAQGQATFDISTLSVGGHNIKAEYLGDLTHAEASDTIPVIVRGFPSTTTLSCGPNATVALGATIPLLATVTSSDGTPIGAVSFTSGKTALGTEPLVNGMASTSATANATGTDSFTATFAQQNGYGYSEASCSVQVQSLTLTSSLNPAPAFAPITFTAVNATRPTPAGQYALTIGSSAPVTMTASADNSSATYTTPGLAPGSYNVMATFTPANGSASYTASLNSGPQIVSAATGDFTLTGPSTLSATTEGTARGTLTLTSIDNFSGNVALSCNLPLPTTYSCTLNPAGVALSVNGVATVTLTLGPNNIRAALTRRPGASRIVLASLLPLTLLSLAGFARRRSPFRGSSFRGFLCLAVLALLAGATTSCGKDVYVSATQPGSYPVIITATGTTRGGTAPSTHTLSIILNLTP